MQPIGADIGDVADEAERGIARRRDQQAAILARHADRDRIVARLAVDRGDEVAVDLADQHHPHDLERLGVGDAQAVAEFRLLAHPLHQRVDLRAAAMDEHAAHADAAQQQHVLGQRPVQSASIAAPPSFTTTVLPREALDVGQGLDEDAARSGRGCCS